MITQIKTSQLIKLSGVLDSSIQYQDVSIILDMNKVDEYMKNINDDLYFSTYSIEENFYKNIAASIINYDEKRHIQIDLQNESQLVTNGIFHLVASHYLKRTHTFVEILENTAGISYLKTKKLLPIKISTIPAINSYLISEYNSEEKINQNFFNQTKNFQSQESITAFYLNKLKDLSKIDDNRSAINKLFIQHIEEVPKEIKNSAEFISEILKEKFTFDKIIENMDSIPSFNFEEEPIKTEILSNKKNTFLIGKFVLERNLKHNTKKTRFYLKQIISLLAQRE